ncbi:hypothetical protein ASE30_09175 [Achromobacter sp. Root83]|nr:hypothetical protein ASE30_09175 [Achromobacter sp. Root83]
MNANLEINATQGHKLTYDANGNRLSDLYWDKVIYADGSTAAGFTTETYSYDTLNRLTTLRRDGQMLDARYYDGADRVVMSGIDGSQGKAFFDRAGLANEQKRNMYDAAGRLANVRVLHMTAGGLASRYNSAYTGYDQAGNVTQYRMDMWDGTSYTNTYTYTHTRYEGYREATLSGVSTQLDPGQTTYQYDVNGNMVGVVDSKDSSKNQTLIHDANGKILMRVQNGTTMRSLVVNGELMGTTGPTAGADDFSPSFRPIDGGNPSASPGSYRIQAGDTLQTIAQQAYGDSRLWYLVAEANGLASDRDLRVGATVTIPNRVTGNHNDYKTFKPYDPGKLIGDTQPTMPVPAADSGGGGGGCGGIGKIFVAVGIAAATGLQSKFSWTNVAAAGVGAGVGSAVASELLPNASSFSERLTRGFVAGAVGGVAASVLSGGKANYVQVAVDAFGNALGNSIVDEMRLAMPNLSPSNPTLGTGLQVTEQQLVEFAPNPLSMDDGGLPLAKLRSSLANGGPAVTYTNSDSDTDFYASLVQAMSEERPQQEGIYLADNGGNQSAALAEAVARLQKGPNLVDLWGKKGSFVYGLTEGRANRSVMDTTAPTLSEKFGAWTRDLFVGAKDAALEVPLMAADTAQLGYLTSKALVTGQADEFTPWSDTGKFAKAGGTLGEYYSAPFDAGGQIFTDLLTGEFEAAGSGAAGLLGGILGTRGGRITGSGLVPPSNGAGSWTRLSSQSRAYVWDIKSQTGVPLTTVQRRLLAEDLRLNEYSKLSKAEAMANRSEFDRIKTSLISEWEANTGQKWPTYSEPVMSKSGNLVRNVGRPYDAHHVIESGYGGPNKWWNIHPARFPDQHQAGLHRSGGPLNEIFKR